MGQLAVIDTTAADVHALCLEEGVGHRAADNQGVAATGQCVHYTDLVGNLGPAEDANKRALGTLGQATESIDFLTDEQSNRRRLHQCGYACDAGVLPMHGAERVVDVDLPEAGKFS